jgi:hypothetical protein
LSSGNQSFDEKIEHTEELIRDTSDQLSDQREDNIEAVVSQLERYHEQGLLSEEDANEYADAVISTFEGIEDHNERMDQLRSIRDDLDDELDKQAQSTGRRTWLYMLTGGTLLGGGALLADWIEDEETAVISQEGGYSQDFAIPVEELDYVVDEEFYSFIDDEDQLVKEVQEVYANLSSGGGLDQESISQINQIGFDIQEEVEENDRDYENLLIGFDDDNNYVQLQDQIGGAANPLLDDWGLNDEAYEFSKDIAQYTVNTFENEGDLE